MLHPLVRQGNYQCIRHNIPREAWRAYLAQYSSARRRGIEFEFEFLDWWKWWQVDDRWSVRGRKRGCVMMARIGDAGPYAPGNVYAPTHKQNSADAKGAVSAGLTAHWAAKTTEQRAAWHLAVRGDGHPQSRAVIDPAGVRYGSGALAAEAHGLTRARVSQMARSGYRGWRWERDTKEFCPESRRPSLMNNPPGD